MLLSQKRLCMSESERMREVIVVGSQLVQRMIDAAMVPAGARHAKELYKEGAEADSAYVVAKGRIVLYRERDGKRAVVDHAGPGTMLGELALIAETSRLTSARAEVDTDLIRLNRKLFRRILEAYPELALMLHDRVVDQLQR